MTHPPRRDARLYAGLLRMVPKSFRDEYAEDMTEFFLEKMRDVRTQSGTVGVLRFWWRTIADLAGTAILERTTGLCKHVHARTTPAAIAHTTTSNTQHSMFNVLGQDIRYAGRTLSKNPVFTLVAVAVVALGTGAVSTIFSVANSIVLRPVPGVENASEVVTIDRTHANGSGSLSASYAYYEDIAAHSRKMSGVAAWTMLPMTISSGAQGVSALGNLVSGNYFDVLGVKPALGRFFQGDERTVRNAYPVAVISHEFWQRQFAGDSGVIGKSMLMNGVTFSIIGVTPKRFSGVYPVLRTDAWVPLMMQPQVRRGGDLLSKQTAAWLEMFGRMAPHVSTTEAQVEITALTKQRTHNTSVGEPTFMTDYPASRVQRASGLPAEATTPITAFIVVLLVVSALVLLIASVNVASMLLARAVSRRREIAVRIALGAGRGRLIGQLLTESVVLFTLGGAAGALLAVFGTRALQAIELPVDVPISLDLAPDFRVLLVTLLIALVTGVLFGLAPALRGSRLEIATTLRNDSAGAGRGRSRLRNALVIGQVAMSLLLLTISGLFVRALDKGRRVDLGIDVTHVAAAALNAGTAGYDTTRGLQLYRNLGARLAALPGVESVGYARILPLSMNSMGEDISIPGYVPTDSRDGKTFEVLDNIVDEGYFAITHMPLVSGRSFHSSDNEQAARVAVVNESFVNQYWPKQNALGRTIEMNGRAMTVVGVVRDTKYNKLDEVKLPFLFLPFAQHWESEVNVLVRTSGDPALMASTIRRELHALDANLPNPVVTTLQQATAVVLLPQRVAVIVTGFLGLAGLALAGIGLYGVISFSAAQRTREIGVRVALGAGRRDVLKLVVGEGMSLVGIGMGIGLVLALVATRALTSFLFGVSPLDAFTFVAVAAILATTALLASYLPARRAAVLDPVVALRQE